MVPKVRVETTLDKSSAKTSKVLEKSRSNSEDVDVVSSDAESEREVSSSGDEDNESSSDSSEVEEESESASEVERGAPEPVKASSLDDLAWEGTTQSRHKRKRGEEDLEGKYMQKLAKEEEREEAKRKEERVSKRQKSMMTVVQGDGKGRAEDDSDDDDDDVEMDDAESDDRGNESDFEIPKHESLTTKPSDEIEKANRTVFLGNVSSTAVTDNIAKKTLVRHMSSLLANLPEVKEGETKHKVESVRFRSTAYTNMLPKKASFVTQDLMDTTTHATNAYVVFSTKVAAREAVKLNGTVVLNRHLRVDSVAHPAQTAPKRCVFVGNLGFVDDESAVLAAENKEGKDGKKKKPRKTKPSDIEEGLWREFSKCGTVENVRVVRDSKTRVGKGIAYVQFTVSIQFLPNSTVY
jgi:nucleolar protein 12